jgi:formylglycine-generating enzyme required for sulfatase activity
MARVEGLLAAWETELPALLEQDFAEAWRAARASIADESDCPLYEGLELEPVVGLVPLGRTEAGLWEFWHPLSGERPVADAAGGYELRPETGLVFVLVPGGARPVGVQTDDPDAPNYCAADDLERVGYGDDDLGVRTPRLDPYFLSKYEMTQAQWYRLTRTNPSRYYAGTDMKGADMCALTCPVEQISWEDCRALADWGMALPTEAQLEVAGRAGTDGVNWWGDEWPPPQGTANFFDRALAITQKMENAERLADDGAALHVPVDELAPNPWGLHHVAGNVAEWCRDSFAAKCYEVETAPGTGELLPSYWTSRSYRGGSWFSQRLALSHRRSQRPDGSHESIGVRPVFEGLE